MITIRRRRGRFVLLSGVSFLSASAGAEGDVTRRPHPLVGGVGGGYVRYLARIHHHHVSAGRMGKLRRHAKRKPSRGVGSVRTYSAGEIFSSSPWPTTWSRLEYRAQHS